MRIRTRARAITMATACALGGTAAAEPTLATDDAPATSRERGGFYARAGYHATLLDNVSPGYKGGHARAGAALDVALGAWLTRSVAVYGEAMAFHDLVLFESAHAVIGAGPGAVVSLPHDLYASATAMRFWISEDRWHQGRTAAESHDEYDVIGTGYGASVAIGKEYGTDPMFRKSVALRGFVGRMSCTSRCTDDGEMMTTRAWTTRGIMLSASIHLD